MSIWDRVLEVIEQEISKPSYETWLKNTILLPFDEDTDTLVIEAENVFVRDWLESRYASLISDTLHDITGKQYKLQFTVNTKNEINQRESPTYQNNPKLNIEQKLDLILKELQTLNERVHTIEADQRELSKIIRAVHDCQG